ncbi:sensor histidine kinase [Pseudoalteromonas sp. T1lg48]|uniref:sensor histidine kinase n=1 Tax=Pseudoalteromonas sp. T1lg48 TaxID=2077100 RepID=UPI000CF6C6D7|nr:HAMP domain-containing sensor histidine kinase [Pseudoalteromonas sp. T1lg48]
MTYSIQRKVLILLVSFAFLLSAMFSGIAFLVSFATEDQMIENVLTQEAQYLRTRYQDGHPLTSRFANIVVFAPDVALPDEYQTLLDAASMGDPEVTGEGEQHWHIKTVELANNQRAYLFLNATAWLAMPSLQENMTILLSVLIAISLLIALAFAYLLTRKITSPLVHLAGLLSTQPHLIATSAVLKRQDEIGLLAREFEHALSALQNSLLRESDFTRDVGHELRTPLAVIKNYLTLQRGRTLQPGELAELTTQVNYVTNCVDSLIALARAEDVEKHTFSLRHTIEETLMSALSPEQLDAFEFIINVPYDLKITAHKALCIVLIRNLLGNALNHAKTPQLVIEATQHYWRFSNDASHMPKSPMSRHTKGESSAGIGQGLYLVNRIASAQHWQCDYTFVDNKFTLTFYWPSSSGE